MNWEAHAAGSGTALAFLRRSGGVWLFVEDTAHNHMNSRITLNLWSCGLILFVLSTRGQALRQSICYDTRLHLQVRNIARGF